MCEDFAPVVQMEHLFSARFLEPGWEISAPLHQFSISYRRWGRVKKERLQVMGGGKVFLSPTSPKNYLYSSLKERGEFLSLGSKMKGISYTA